MDIGAHWYLSTHNVRFFHINVHRHAQMMRKETIRKHEMHLRITISAFVAVLLAVPLASSEPLDERDRNEVFWAFKRICLQMSEPYMAFYHLGLPAVAGPGSLLAFSDIGSDEPGYRFAPVAFTVSNFAYRAAAINSNTLGKERCAIFTYRDVFEEFYEYLNSDGKANVKTQLNAYGNRTVLFNGSDISPDIPIGLLREYGARGSVITVIYIDRTR